MTPPMLADVASGPLLTPRQEAYLRQEGCCGACGTPIKPDAPFARRWTNGPLLWLTCYSCRVKRPALATIDMSLARLAFPPLLSLRLRVGQALDAQPVTPADASALARRDWDHFPSLSRVLWVAQGGTCVFAGDGRLHEEPIVVDHGHQGKGFVRGLLCTACNVAEGKNARVLATRAPAYRRRPIAQRLIATRGLTYRYMRLGEGA